MPSSFRLPLATPIVGLLASLLLPASAGAQQIAPVQVIRIAAGPAGAETNGSFALAEERSVFSRSSDREVIVVFQWEDRPGPHKLVGQWRSPDGASSMSSAFDYNAGDKRFGAVWRLPVTVGMPLGVWSIEVTMDGRPAGRHTIDITDAKVEGPIVRRPLTQSELFERLNPLFVVLRRTASDGRELEPAAGFIPAPSSGRIYTVVPAIDAADSLRAVGADGTVTPITQLVAWDRDRQWALVQGREAAGASLGVAAPETVKIGSPCFSIEGSASGARALTVGILTGYAGTTAERVLIATFSGFGMPGAPVVDEQGDLLGIVAAGLPKDPRPVDYLVEARGTVKGVPVIPFTLVRPPAAAAIAELSALRGSGEVMPALVPGYSLSIGGFTREVVKRGDTSGPDLVKEFSIGEAMIRVLVEWAPVDRIRGNAALRVSNSLNRLIATSQPRKVDFKKSQYVRSSWEIPMVKDAGIYRVDVTVDGRTYWRAFVRINP